MSLDWAKIGYMDRVYGKKKKYQPATFGDRRDPVRDSYLRGWNKAEKEIKEGKSG